MLEPWGERSKQAMRALRHVVALASALPCNQSPLTRLRITRCVAVSAFN